MGEVDWEWYLKLRVSAACGHACVGMVERFGDGCGAGQSAGVAPCLPTTRHALTSAPPCRPRPAPGLPTPAVQREQRAQFEAVMKKARIDMDEPWGAPPWLRSCGCLPACVGSLRAGLPRLAAREGGSTTRWAASHCSHPPCAWPPHPPTPTHHPTHHQQRTTMLSRTTSAPRPCSPGPSCARSSTSCARPPPVRGWRALPAQPAAAVLPRAAPQRRAVLPHRRHHPTHSQHPTRVLPHPPHLPRRRAQDEDGRRVLRRRSGRLRVRKVLVCQQGACLRTLQRSTSAGAMILRLRPCRARARCPPHRSAHAHAPCAPRTAGGGGD